MNLKEKVLPKLFIMDVDGTLTDGRIYIGKNGEVFKAFHIKDGYGIRDILSRYGILPVIITGRISEIVEQRAEELGISQLYQGVSDKGACLRKIAAELQISSAQMACMGDDMNDLSMMNLCSIRGCPADAALEVKQICDYVCQSAGGHGAVREFIEWLVKKEKYNVS